MTVNVNPHLVMQWERIGASSRYPGLRKAVDFSAKGPALSPIAPGFNLVWFKVYNYSFSFFIRSHNTTFFIHVYHH